MQAQNPGAIQGAGAGSGRGEHKSCSQEVLLGAGSSSWRSHEVSGGLGSRGQEMLKQVERCRRWRSSGNAGVRGPSEQGQEWDGQGWCCPCGGPHITHPGRRCSQLPPATGPQGAPSMRTPQAQSHYGERPGPAPRHSPETTVVTARLCLARPREGPTQPPPAEAPRAGAHLGLLR